MDQKAYIDQAAEHFRTLLAQQLQRQERMAQGSPAKDFAHMDHIVIGLIPGDGIGPIIMAQARRVLEKLLADLQTLRVEYPDDGWTRTPEGDAALDARRVAAGFSAARYNHVLPEPGMLTEQDALALARQVLESDGGLSADVLNDPESEMYAVCTQEDGKTVWTVWRHNAVGICAVAIDAADGTILDMIIDTGMAGNG